MKICKSGHSKIVHETENCPLCSLTKHNLIVHQFIESKEIDLVDKLIKYQEMQRQKEKNCATCVNEPDIGISCSICCRFTGDTNDEDYWEKY